MSECRSLKVAFNLPVKKLFTYLPAENIEYKVGMRVKVPFGKREIQGFIAEISEEAPEGDFEFKSITKIMDSSPLFDSGYWQTAKWVAAMYMCGWGEALYAMLPGGKREKDIDDDILTAGVSCGALALTEDQKLAVKIVLEGKSSIYYLHGVTGSGKTEVFLSLAENMVSQGKGVIYLVPEIALTHQMIETVERRFPGNIALLNSSLTPAQRLSQWRKIQNQEANIVIGVRSAVFAPVRNLGLIIMDEEHETSYKSDASPRYHARQVAMYRAKKEHAKLIMGSATPSVEAYYLMNKGVIEKLTLPERVSGGIFPEIKVVNMLDQRSFLSGVLRDEIEKAASQGKQTILFLNRRGFFYNFICFSCGFELKCSHCSVPLTYHRNRDLLICHYCGYSQRPLKVCPNCGSLDTGYSGFGTEKIEEDLKKIFPFLKILRLDSDSASKGKDMRDILNRFAEKKADILLGTQMVAKGFNFPSVSLVGIILADTTLQMPDFRAAERTFALLTQVAGRAGRFSSDGKVIIQTYRPENYAISSAAAMDERAFYSKELKMREEMQFPPFSRLFRFVFRGKEKEKTAAAARSFSGTLSERSSKGDFKIMGPAECPLAVISDNFRYHIIVDTPDFSGTHALLSDALSSFKAPSGVYIEIDVDPVSLM